MLEEETRGEKKFVLAKKNRLKNSREFKKVYSFGKKINANYFFVKYSKNSLNVARFGIVVSRKISVKAVQRNKIKRRVCSIIRDLLKDYNKSYDIVLISRKNIIKASFKDIQEDIRKILLNIF